jgi:hypothetical protein
MMVAAGGSFRPEEGAAVFKILKTKSTWLFIALALGVCAFHAVALAGPEDPSKPAYLYKTTFLRAAPGRLLDLIALVKNRMAFIDAAGDERPLWWRHTQGDQWDLMLIHPMSSYAEFYSPERLAKRSRAAESAPVSPAAFQKQLDACLSWKEDLFVLGPPLEYVRKKFTNAALYHVEIMVSLPGKQEELVRERRMESAYQVAMGRPEYMVFVRDQGAGWDVYTLACYRDVQHWAESPALTKEQREEAARKAGFPSPEAIGPYMRTLIEMHRDTQGVAIK